MIPMNTTQLLVRETDLSMKILEVRIRLDVAIRPVRTHHQQLHHIRREADIDRSPFTAPLVHVRTASSIWPRWGPENGNHLPANYGLGSEATFLSLRVAVQKI
jgi:hypothetical protein